MFEGLDQINIVAGPELKGIGETDILLTVDGQIGNAVRINSNNSYACGRGWKMANTAPWGSATTAQRPMPSMVVGSM
jgi:hypothetical protein